MQSLHARFAAAVAKCHVHLEDGLVDREQVPTQQIRAISVECEILAIVCDVLRVTEAIADAIPALVDRHTFLAAAHHSVGTVAA